MPRNGGGVYSLPGGSAIANGDTSDASDLNTPFDDLETDMNTARPIVAGGTGATTAAAAATALGVGTGDTVEFAKAGIGGTLTDGTLHVLTASAGTVTGYSVADELVLENSGHAGMTILCPDASIGSIYWGTPTESEGAYLSWDYTNTNFTIATHMTGGTMQFSVNDNDTLAIHIDSAGQVGMGTSSPESVLHVTGGGDTATDASTILAVENSASASDVVRLSLISGASGNCQLAFGDTAQEIEGRVRYTQSTNLFEIICGFGNSSSLSITDGAVMIPQTSTPASASATGTTGTIAWDSSYIYVCVATDTWKRVSINTWA